MPDFREWYKRLGVARENVLVGRAIRTQRQNEQRRERRSQLFCVHRDQNQCSDNLEEANSKEDTTSSSKQRDDTAKTNDDEESSKQHAVAKWRKERYLRKLAEKRMTKPPFKVGIVHHRLYSPPLSKNPYPSPPGRLCKSKESQPAPVPVKAVSKATQNRRAAKAQESKEKLEAKKLKKSQEVLKVPLVPKYHEFKAPEGVNAIPLFGRRALEAAQESVLKSGTSTAVNISIASFISEEGCTLTPNNTSTPIPAPAASLSPFMVCGGNKDIARKELEEALSSSSENNFFQMDFLKDPFREPTPGQLQNESPSKLSTHEEDTKTLTPKNTKELNPPSASLSPFKVCSSDDDNAREEVQKPVANLFGTNCLQTNSSRNLFPEFVHTENYFRKAGASLKKLSQDEPAHALAEQTPLSSQPFKRLSPFKITNSDGDDAHKERLGTEKNVKTDFSKNLYYEFAHIHPENSLHNEAPASPKKLPEEEAANTLVEEADPLPTQLINRLSLFTAPSSDKGDGTCEQLQRSPEKKVQTDFSKPEENTTQYYRYLLNKETERLNGLCDSWDLVKKATSTPEDIQYLIQSAIGQTQLLIGKKFKRFGGLVQDCETGEGEMLVTCKDLLGFWELMYIEVEDCNGRFSKLEKLKANGWIDKAAEQLKQKPTVKKATVAKKKVPAARSDSLKAYIATARKKMQNYCETVTTKTVPKIVIQGVDDNLGVPTPGDPAEVQGKALNEKTQEMRNNEEILSSSELKIPKIEINDACVQEKDENSNNVLSSKAPASQVSTPVKKLVLRKVHLPSKSPLIALKISKMCKTPELFHINPKDNTFERVSPAKENTSGVKSSKLKGKCLEFSPRKDDTPSSLTPRLTPQRRSLRIQKFSDSKNLKNQDA